MLSSICYYALDRTRTRVDGPYMISVHLILLPLFIVDSLSLISIRLYTADAAVKTGRLEYRRRCDLLAYPREEGRSSCLRTPGTVHPQRASASISVHVNADATQKMLGKCLLCACNEHMMLS